MKKVTMLFGAGAALPWEAPKTIDITKAIKNSTDHLVGTECLGKFIDNLLRNEIINTQENINFETYVDFIESACTYLLETNSNVHYFMKSSLYKIFELKPEVKELMSKIQWANGSRFLSDADKAIHIFYSFIRIIGNQIIKYLSNYEDEKLGLNEKLRLFCEHFMKIGYSVRSYTLNYDRSIPLVFERVNSKYEIFDGFNIENQSDNKKRNGLYALNKSKIINDIDCNSFYNLHGSFHWSFQECDYKGNKNQIPFALMSSKSYEYSPSYQRVEEYLTKSNPNEKLLPSNIITGYRKTQRINVEPFNYFFHSFFYDLQQSEIIIIVGYSYADPHINQLLRDAIRRNVRIYNITYQKLPEQKLINGYVGLAYEGMVLKNYYPESNNWFKDVESFYSEYNKGFEEFLKEDEWLNIQPL